jgi:hypothetical protein
LLTQIAANPTVIVVVFGLAAIWVNANNPDEKIKLKMFHAEIIKDDKKLN